jgi:hypothetical protein
MKHLLWLTLFCLTASADITGPVVPSPSGSGGAVSGGTGIAVVGNTVQVSSSILNTPMRYICGAMLNLTNAIGQGYAATFVGETNRLTCITNGPVTRLQLFMPMKYQTGGVETSATLPNAVFHQAAIEYPSGQPSGGPMMFTQNGNTWMSTQPNSSGALSDPLGVNIPANTVFYLRYGTYVTTPPASLSIAAAAGGSLTASTTYYYKATCVRFGSESNSLTEVSQATGASNLTLNLTFTATAGPLGCDTINIYRSLTTGTELYLASITSPGLQYSDTGAISTVAGISPPTTSGRYMLNNYLLAPSSGSPMTEYSDNVPAGGSGANLVNAVGTTGLAIVGPKGSVMVQKPLVLADDILNPTACGLGDSIMAGSGVLTAQASQYGGSPSVADWFYLGTQAAGIYNRMNDSLSGTKATAFTSNGFYGTSERMWKAQYCDYILSDLSINDLNAGETWQTLATTQYQIAQAFSNRGKYYYITTLLPFTTSTDNDLTTAHQSVTAYESQRVAYNTWVRDGMQFTYSTCTGSITTTVLTVTGTCSNLAVGTLLSTPNNNSSGNNGAGIAGNTSIGSLGTGTGGAGTYNITPSQTVASSTFYGVTPVTSGGTASPYIKSYFDMDASMGEVNSSNVLTANGGYWPAPCSTSYTVCQQTASGTGTLNGTPTTTSLPYTAWTGVSNAANYALIGYLVAMTSGVAAGQTCLINNSTSTTITCNGNSTALTSTPAAGDTFAIYQGYTQEGTHPSFWGNITMATGSSGAGLNFQTWAAANFVGQH